MKVVQRTIQYGAGFERQLSTRSTLPGGTVRNPVRTTGLDRALLALLGDNDVWEEVRNYPQSQGSTGLSNWTYTIEKGSFECDIQYVAVGPNEIELMTFKETTRIIQPPGGE